MFQVEQKQENVRPMGEFAHPLFLEASCPSVGAYFLSEELAVQSICKHVYAWSRNIYILWECTDLGRKSSIYNHEIKRSFTVMLIFCAKKYTVQTLTRTYHTPGFLDREGLRRCYV